LTEREGEEIGEKMVLTCGAHMSTRGRGVRGTGSVFFLGYGLLPLTGPKDFPGSKSIFISSFLFFLFLISDLNLILCNLESKHFKQLLSYSDNQHSVLNQ
jgi:hypothetical protein